MILGMYAIYDKHTGYLIPSFYQNDEVAKRAFHHDVNSPDMSLISANPDDFQLEKVGSYNTETSELIDCKPVIVCCATQFVGKE